jgi:hypothetical protein
MLSPLSSFYAKENKSTVITTLKTTASRFCEKSNSAITKAHAEHLVFLTGNTYNIVDAIEGDTLMDDDEVVTYLYEVIVHGGQCDATSLTSLQEMLSHTDRVLRIVSDVKTGIVRPLGF